MICRGWAATPVNKSQRVRTHSLPSASWRPDVRVGMCGCPWLRTQGSTPAVRGWRDIVKSRFAHLISKNHCGSTEGCRFARQESRKAQGSMRKPDTKPLI
eukprot:765813-Hanusia_phi.AAC.1